MMNLRSFDNIKFLREARDLAEQKGLSVEVVIKAVESTLQVASRKRYGNYQIKAVIDRKTGVPSIYRKLLVVGDGVHSDNVVDQSIHSGRTEEEAEDDDGGYDFIPISEALTIKPDVQVGEKMMYQLPLEFDESSQGAARQKMSQVIRIEEQKKQYEEYRDRVGEVIYGVVKNTENGNVIVDLNGNEGFLPRFSLIKGEAFRQGDKVKAYIEDVRQANIGHQIYLSRTHKEFVGQLFKHEVPEISDGIVTVKAVARDPGSRSKVAVFSSDRNVDPAGSCIGIRGSRIRGIIAELHGEKIDIVLYSSDLAKFVVAAIAPAEVMKVIIDEDNAKIELVIPENQLSLAIGRHGQNIKLASELVGWKIDVLSDTADSVRRNEEFVSGTSLFVRALDVEEIIGQLLVAEGFLRVEDICESSINELTRINGFTPEIAEELQKRAVDYLTTQKEAQEAAISNLDIDEEIKKLPFLQFDDLAAFSSSAVKTMEDVAALSRDEFYECVTNSGLSFQQVDEIIMEARRKVGWLE